MSPQSHHHQNEAGLRDCLKCSLSPYPDTMSFKQQNASITVVSLVRSSLQKFKIKPNILQHPSKCIQMYWLHDVARHIAQWGNWFRSWSPNWATSAFQSSSKRSPTLKACRCISKINHIKYDKSPDSPHSPHSPHSPPLHLLILLSSVGAPCSILCLELWGSQSCQIVRVALGHGTVPWVAWHELGAKHDLPCCRFLCQVAHSPTSEFARQKMISLTCHHITSSGKSQNAIQ